MPNIKLNAAYYSTLMSLSQPADTMIGLAGFGEKRTDETHSEWPSSVMVSLHSPRVFHSLMDLSLDPLTICLLSGEKDTLRTSAECPTNCLVHFPVAMSHRRSVLSHDADSANCPSEDHATSCTKWLCPVSARLATLRQLRSTRSSLRGPDATQARSCREMRTAACRAVLATWRVL